MNRRRFGWRLAILTLLICILCFDVRMSQTRVIKKKEKKEPMISNEQERETTSPIPVNAGDRYL
jgi:hypothetical protein